MTTSVRERIVEVARWGVQNEPQIHYAMTRPIPLDRFKARSLPITTDCSGYVTGCFYAAGAPNPNGYDGKYPADHGTSSPMFTGTLLAANQRITLADAAPGDLVVFGAGDGEHVVIISKADADPMVISHGTEGGPAELRLSTERAYHVGQLVTVLRAPVPTTVPKPPPTWQVNAGDGTLIAASVARPTLWALAHWRLFRTRQEVIFRRRP